MTLVAKGSDLHTDMKFEGAQTGVSFVGATFKDCAGDKTTFTNCNFNYCVFERSYFHHAVFDNCKFVGARFIDCNFREAAFRRCDLRFLAVRGTAIEIQQLLQTLPSEPNIRRSLIRSIRANCAALGEFDSVKRLVREEIKAEREHYRQARAGKDWWYADHYGTWQKKISIYWQSFAHTLDRWVWGHGEYPLRLAVAAACFLLFAGFTASAYAPAEGAYPFRTEGFVVVAKVFFALPGDPPVWAPIWLLPLVALGRFVFFGLFVGVISKLISRR